MSKKKEVVIPSAVIVVRNRKTELKAVFNGIRCYKHSLTVSYFRHPQM